MSSGERPIGAAKGKQSDTEALCQTNPPRSPPPPPPPHFTGALPSRGPLDSAAAHTRGRGVRIRNGHNLE